MPLFSLNPVSGNIDFSKIAIIKKFRLNLVSGESLLKSRLEILGMAEKKKKNCITPRNTVSQLSFDLT